MSLDRTQVRSHAHHLSALTLPPRLKMFYFLKSLVRKLVETPSEASAQEPTSSATAPAATLEHHATTRPHHGASQNGNGRGIDVPVQAILASLPLELQPKVRQTDVGDMTICVPLEKILSQLSRGNVKITFRELRQGAPEVFTSERDRDAVLVVLPLQEILSRLNPALLARRRVQRQVVVPAEISSPFDAQGQGLIFSVGPAKPEAAAPRKANGTPAPAAPAIPQRRTITSAPTPPPPTALPPTAPTLIPGPRTPKELHTSKVPAPPPSQPKVPAAPKPPQPSPAPAPAKATVPAKPVVDGHEKPSGETMVLGLTSLAEAWPEAVRHEIVQLNLVDAKVALPNEVVAQALKAGRIAFSWKVLRSWIKPSPLPSVSAHDGTVLELPLKIVAPLFLARQKEATKAQPKISIDEDIPNLFFGFPQGDGNATPAHVPTGNTPPALREREERPGKPDTNYYVWDDSADTVRLHESEVKRGPSPGTRFVAKYATPNEVVSRAAALDGVAGALIALPDGLMVASRLPADLNGDTLAAFLPHIFGKVSQCTKELRMGELNNLSFTVGNVPWKIFRVNAIFFAAFGRAGEAMSTADLAALAGELDHKK